jgi:hypothetical protein
MSFILPTPCTMSTRKRVEYPKNKKERKENDERPEMRKE